MTNPTSVADRDSKLREMFRRWRTAHLKAGPNSQTWSIFEEFRNELIRYPGFVASAKENAKSQERRRTALIPVEDRKNRSAWDSAKASGLRKVLKLLSAENGDKHMVRDCGYSIHAAACTYWQHSLKGITKLQKSKGYTLRRKQPVDTAANCLKRLNGNLRSTPYIWKKAWAATSPAALDALIQSSNVPFPIFAGTPSPDEIEPFLSAAIKFSTRSNSPTQEKRDDLLVAVLLAYARITSKRPPLSRSATNPTIEFMKAVELAYKELLPNGFNIPLRSHSKLDRLRARAVRLMLAQQ